MIRKQHLRRRIASDVVDWVRDSRLRLKTNVFCGDGSLLKKLKESGLLTEIIQSLLYMLTG